MPRKKLQGGAYTWVSFIGLLLLLIGIYATVRTAINLAVFEKYPLGGALSINFSGGPAFYGPREEDCLLMPPAPYLYEEGNSLSSSEEAMVKQKEKEQQQSCINSAKEARDQAKVNDISQSLLFLFLGAGVLITRRKIFTS